MMTWRNCLDKVAASYGVPQNTINTATFDELCQIVGEAIEAKAHLQS